MSEKEKVMKKFLEARKLNEEYKAACERLKDHPNRHICYSLEWDEIHYGWDAVERKLLSLKELL